jgi:O-antigen biosynthesis protein
MTPYSDVFILTGMHRSGTSLLGMFLSKSRIDMGDELLGPHRSNPYGHFEDVAIMSYHRCVLRRENNGEDQWVTALPTLTAEDKQRASQLVHERRSKGRPWGWKEPRTCLFLDLWAELIPEARFAFVLRHPRLVVDSLCRRHRIARRDWRTHHRFLRSWHFYNEQVITFHRSHKERSIVFSVDRALQQPDNFVRALSQFSGHRFATEDLVNSFDENIFARRAAGRIVLNLPMLAKAEVLYRQLLRLSVV